MIIKAKIKNFLQEENMLNIENNANIESIVNWIKNYELPPLESELRNLEQLFFNEKKIGKTIFHFKSKRIQREIQKYEIAIENLENLKNFSPSRLYIEHQIIETINSILPLLDVKDKDVIESIFYEAQNAVRSKDESELNQIKANSKILEECINDAHYIDFLKSLKEQEQIFKAHDYLTKIHFNTPINDDNLFIIGTDKHILDMMYKLMRAGKLNNKYIKNNIEKIKNAYISIRKMNFVNAKIDELLALNITTSDIDFEKLKVILINIKTKNQKSIDESSKVLEHFSEEELYEEYSKYMQEQYDRIRRKQIEPVEEIKQETVAKKM